MRQVAALAGVSAKTVSRVMNNDRYVSDEVRGRVQQAIRDLQYVPNTLAQSFRSGRDAAIGIAVPDIADPFFATLIQAAERVAKVRRTAVFVTSLGSDPADERAGVEALLGRRVAGLISTPISADQAYLKPWQSRTALVFIDRTPKGIIADSVVEDDVGGAQTATAHLIGHGHRRIGFIGDALSVSTTAKRLKGYRTALAGADLGNDPVLIALGATSSDTAAAAARRLLSQPDPPTAIFSSNARTSIAIVPVLQAINRTDLALISFGDFALADALDPAVSVIDQDPNSVGEIAATRLFERMEHPHKRLKRSIVLPVALVARASCCPPSWSNPDSSAALGA